MGRFASATLGLLAGYVIGAAVGIGLVAAFSGNVHDKSLEMVMTGAFATGPVGAIIGLVLGLVLSGRGRKPGT
jgi:hypothetical protein